MGPEGFLYPLLPAPPEGSFGRKDCVPKFLELVRWPNGVSCPQCGSGNIIKLKKLTRPHKGRYVYNCRCCRRQFTVTTKTALHRTHVPLESWLEAIALAERRAETPPASELVRELKVTHKTALAMGRILKQRGKDEFLKKLCPPLKMYKTPEAIFRRLFPDVFEN